MTGARIAAAIVLSSLGACASPPLRVSQIGPDTFTIVKRSQILSDRSDKLKAQADDDALAWCQARGRAMAVLDSRVVDPDPPAYASATVTFACVAP